MPSSLSRCRLALTRLEEREVPATLVNINAPGTLQGNGDVQFLDASADGRYVLFSSTATDLVANQVDVAGTRDVFWRDTLTGRTVLVTAAAGLPTQALGATGFIGATVSTLGSAEEAVLSSDGLYVAFTSRVQASRIVTGAAADTDGTTLDAFFVDLSGGTAVTSFVSVQTDGTAVGDDGRNVLNIAVSGSGRYVSYTTDLVGTQIDSRVTDDAAATTDLFRRDMSSTAFNDPTTPATQAVSIVNGDPTRLVGVTDSVQVVSRFNTGSLFVNSRGSYVDDTGSKYVFTTIADANDELLLTSVDRNDTSDVFARDMADMALTAVSLATNGEMVGNTAAIDSADGIISANGVTTVYITQADRTAGNVPIADLTNPGGFALIAVRGGTQKLVNNLLNAPTLTATPGGVSNFFAVSNNGARIVFDSTDVGLATNAVDVTGNDVFAFDVAAGTNQYVSVDAQNQFTVGGTITSSLVDPVSADGLLVVYQGNGGPAVGTDATVADGLAAVVVRDLVGQTNSIISTTPSRDTGLNGAARGVYRASGTNGVGYFESAETGVFDGFPTSGNNLYAATLPVAAVLPPSPPSPPAPPAPPAPAISSASAVGGVLALTGPGVPNGAQVIAVPSDTIALFTDVTGDGVNDLVLANSLGVLVVNGQTGQLSSLFVDVTGDGVSELFLFNPDGSFVVTDTRTGARLA